MMSNVLDIAVAIVFFNRPDTLNKVFESVRKARPSTLFLIPDGPRENNQEDAVKVRECRSIVSGVDWPCNVTEIYRQENRGVAHNIYSGISEAFEKVEKLVIIEDDIVIDQSFLPFCKELLDKYEHDERVFAITGMNHMVQYDSCPYSYFFSDIGSCWGWATWKRSWDKMEFTGDFLEDDYAVGCFLNSSVRTKRLRSSIIKESKKRRLLQSQNKRVTGWAHQFMISQYMNSGWWIVPKVNLITNIGLSEDSVHAASSLKLIPKKLQKVFYAKTIPLSFPLDHPKYIIGDRLYSDAVLSILGEGWFQKASRRAESLFRFVLFSSWDQKKSKIKKALFH